MTKSFETYWGIDISKNWLDIAIGERVTRLEQTEKAIKGFINQSKADNTQTLVVLESTGGYEQLAVKCLSHAGLVVHVAHPNKVKAFARAKGRLAKSDKIDAKLLKEYGAFIHVNEIRPLPTARQNELASLGSRLEQLKDMHHQESCRLGIVTEGAVKKSIKNLLASLKKQVEMVNQLLNDIVQSDSELQEKYKILCSMKGVGPVLAMKLLTDLPELGEANKKEIAALVGVAPITNDSGNRTGKAMTKYGRSGIRKVLYMGALVASRHDPKLRAFYEKLIGAGKLPKVALVAVMRKMIVILNAMIQSKQSFLA